ncbi:MAG: hypothetical protein WB508_10400 [Aeromicrobium sp.]|uniref:hypothetical protein n=1 Tax=Aeromicrobium sp. TaxID=1871063 RepID=UPI003C5515B9
MTETVAWGVALASLAVAGYAAWHTARDAPFSNPLFYLMALLEIGLVTVLIGGSIALARTDRDVDGVLFVSYLITVAVIPPAAVLWGIAEKSRWGTGVVAVALLSVAVLAARLHGIWAGTYV